MHAVLAPRAETSGEVAARGHALLQRFAAADVLLLWGIAEPQIAGATRRVAVGKPAGCATIDFEKQPG